MKRARKGSVPGGGGVGSSASSLEPTIRSNSSGTQSSSSTSSSSSSAIGLASFRKTRGSERPPSIRSSNPKKKGKSEKEQKEEEEKDARRRWPALESNPEGFTKYMHQIGVPTSLEFHDVLGLDAELLGMIPPPIRAIILLYPIADSRGDAMMPTAARKRAKPKPNAPFFLWQGEELGHACGLIALLHALGNTIGGCDKSLRKNSTLARFLAKTWEQTPEERGQSLEQDQTFRAANRERARDEEVNQTRRKKRKKEGSEEEEEDEEEEDEPSVDFHFVTFVRNEKDSCVYELDGCRNQPMKRGVGVAQADFPKECAKIIRKQYMQRCPDSVQFVMLALAAAARPSPSGRLTQS